MIDLILEQVRQELQKSIDAKTKDTAQHFFKEKITAYGVKIPVVNTIGNAFLSKIKRNTKEEVFSLCEELWRSGMLEESFIACHWSYAVCETFVPSDFEVFERWVLKYVDNWASCDTLCNHTIGTFMEMYPQFLPKLKEWATAENRWTRRAAAVTLIIPARKGLFLRDIFELAEILLEDKDDLVQKGYGWMLKAASQANQNEVFDFVMNNKSRLPRTALRYAIEKMPQERKAEAMKR
jgi:3-methyladenine DNA glycosylase AlkD